MRGLGKPDVEAMEFVQLYAFAKEFGWTAQQFFETDAKTIDALTICMSERAKVERDEMERQKSRVK